MSIPRPEYPRPQMILVPFCPESPLSQVGYTDFMPAVWYRRELDLPALKLEGRQLLHFGAVDYHCKVWINGQLCGSHTGGYASFTLDATGLLRPGRNTSFCCCTRKSASSAIHS